MKSLGLLSVLLMLAACGPMSLPEAERQCFERARLAKQPRGAVTVGAGAAPVEPVLRMSIPVGVIVFRRRLSS